MRHLTGTMNQEELGTLFGVGVGPGDPGMVTLRAVEIIKAVPTVAFPVHRKGADSRAYRTVRQHIPETTARLPLVMPMTKTREKLTKAHEAAADALVEAAEQRRDVAYLSVGDPLFYSTFGYLAERFPGKVEVVSGISAMSAFAAAAGLPLAAGDTPTVVVTGAAHHDLEKALEMGASVLIIKPRSLSKKSLELLESTGALERAGAAIELGGPSQHVIEKLDRQAASKLPYFAIIWIRDR